MRYNLNKKRCVKQITFAIIENNGQYWAGTNACKTPQTECPRGNLSTGLGYEKCKEICHQSGHAEIEALRIAGKEASGGTLYLLGHYYICDNCRKAIDLAGIKQVIIVKDFAGQVKQMADNKIKEISNGISELDKELGK
jgi:deoxycytidylate deaminase